MELTSVHVEGFLSFVFIWIFLALTFLTARVVYTGIIHLSNWIYRKITAPSEMDIKMDAVLARLDALIEKSKS